MIYVKRVLPRFSSKSFIVSGLKFKSLIHFEFIFMYCVRECSDFLILYKENNCPVFSAPLIAEAVALLQCMFWPPLPKIRWPEVCGFISGLSVLFCQFIFLSLCHYHTVLIPVALKYSLRSGSLIPPAPFLFLVFSTLLLLVEISCVSI